MAVSGADLSAIVKEVVQPYVQDNINKEKFLLDQLKRNANTEVYNGTIYAPVRSQRHSGITNLAADTSKLKSGNDSTLRANVGVKIMTGTFDITDFARKATNTTKKAVANEAIRQADSLKSDFAKAANRQFFSDGVGVVAQVSGSVSGSQVTFIRPNSNIDDGRVKDTYGSINGDCPPEDYIVPGQIIGVGTAAADTGTVSTISGGTITFTGAVNSAANDALYILDGDGAGAGTSEIQGLKSAINSDTTGTYAGIDRTAMTWTAQADTVSEALSLATMETIYLKARKYKQGKDRFAWFVNQSLYRKFGSLLTSLRRTVDEMELVSGWSGLKFQVGDSGMLGVILDEDVPDGAAFLVNLDTWTIAQVEDMSFAEDGAFLRKTDYLTYQKVMVWYVNLLCVAPAANGVLHRKTA